MTISLARRQKLAAIAKAHDAWVDEQLAVVSADFDPAAYPKPGSDYNQHNVDVDASGEAEDELAAKAAAIFGTPMTAAGDPDWDESEHPRGSDGKFTEDDTPAGFTVQPRAVPVSGTNTFETARTIGEYVKFDKVTLARNASLRSGKPSPEAKAWRARMAEAINSQRIENDSVVYRGAAFKPGMISQLKPGAILSDRGVTSTDVDKESAQFYAGRRQLKDPSATIAMFEIKVPAGMPGYDADYGEFVFGPDSSMRILATRETPQGIEVTAELIAPDGD